MATVRKRNGRYQVQIRVGRAQALTRTFDTKNEARAWVRETEGKIQSGTTLVAKAQTETNSYDKITLCQVLEQYRIRIISKRHWQSREVAIIKQFAKSPLYHMSIERITEGKVAEYRDKRLEVAKPATVVRELALASHCLTVARREWDYPVTSNPFKLVKKPKLNNGRSRRLNDEEWKRLVENDAKRGRLSIIDIIEFAIETAVRKGELLRIEWSHIDFDQSTLHIPITKNGHPRTIPLTPRAKKILQSKSLYSKQRLVFNIAYFALTRRWQSLLRKAGIDGLRFHDLRHEGISRHFENGLNVPEVALISGHRDYKLLQRYTHIRPENVAIKMVKLSAGV